MTNVLNGLEGALARAAELLDMGYTMRVRALRSDVGRYDGSLLFLNGTDEVESVPIRDGLTSTEATEVMGAVKAALVAHMEHGTPLPVPTEAPEPAPEPTNRMERGQLRAMNGLKAVVGADPIAVIEQGDATELTRLIETCETQLAGLVPSGKKRTGAFHAFSGVLMLARERLSGVGAPGVA